MGGSVGTEEYAGLGLLLLHSRCELRALSATTVAFLLLVSGLKGEDTGEGSSGCQPSPLGCPVSRDSTMRIQQALVLLCVFLLSQDSFLTEIRQEQ